MVVISELSSYPWTYCLLFQLTPYGLAIVLPFLLFPAIIRPLLSRSYCSPFLLFPLPYCSQNSMRLRLLLYIKGPSWAVKALSLT
jgi:hypothetical protein